MRKVVRHGRTDDAAPDDDDASTRGEISHVLDSIGCGPQTSYDCAMEPVRFGVLGAARISGIALYDPARETGTPLLAIAARDRRRAETIAEEVGIPRVYDSYQDVIDDPEIEAIYNPLPNGLHGPWNLRAIAAGKHVLTEKPFASNTTEATLVHDSGVAAGVHVIDAIHYRYHPLRHRMVELAESGELGDVVAVEATMVMPPPGDADPRWNAALAGGSMMDIGMYALHGARQVAHLLGGEPMVVSAEGGEIERHPGTDAWMHATLEYPNGVQAKITSDMTAGHKDFSLRFIGTKGNAYAPAFVQPWENDTIIVTTEAGQRVEHTSTKTTYLYQLEAFTRLLRLGEAMPTDSADAIRQAELIDRCYVLAGMQPRPVTVLQ